MVTSLDVHPIQSAILITLLFKPVARFSELNKLGIPSDQFNFHVKTLLSKDLLEKTSKGYKLTNTGKEFANRFDTDNREIERQAKIGVLVCVIRKKKEVLEYLLQQRLKQPYYGFWGFITGKVRWGEGVLETAKRELKEETGLEARFKIVGVKHKTDYDKSGKILEDKFFFVIKGTDPKGELKVRFEGGKNKWLAMDRIFKTKGLFPDVEATLKMLRSKYVNFKEFKFEVGKY